MKKGLYGKYIIEKADGTPLEGFYFVLKPETDVAARAALRTYIEVTDNQKLAEDLAVTLEAWGER